MNISYVKHLIGVLDNLARQNPGRIHTILIYKAKLANIVYLVIELNITNNDDIRIISDAEKFILSFVPGGEK
jgi:hypothetical protein